MNLMICLVLHHSGRIAYMISGANAGADDSVAESHDLFCTASQWQNCVYGHV